MLPCQTTSSTRRNPAFQRSCAAYHQTNERPAAYPNSARSTLPDRGWQQPLNCHEARSACRVKDAEGTAQPLVLDPARWLCYLARPQAVPVAIRRSNVHVQHIIKRMNAPPPTQTPQGQPCLTGVGNNPLTVTKHGQRAASRMPKARRSRLSLTRRAGCATLPDHKQYPSRPSPKSSLKELCCHLSI